MHHQGRGRNRTPASIDIVWVLDGVHCQGQSNHMRPASQRRIAPGIALGIELGILLALSPAAVLCQSQKSVSAAPDRRGVPLSQFLVVVRQKAKSLENTSGMRLGFQSFTADHHLSPDSVRYSDYVLIRLLFEATRDAGFWNLHWNITDQPPNSDNIWRQWHAVNKPSISEPTATAECDELSALYAFLVERAGVKSVGLFWPTSNHTVAVWVLHPTDGALIRVVVPTSQIFLGESDDSDTKQFNPWKQKTIYEYTRRDVPDSFEIPKALADFFLLQIDKYAGASNATLQRLRYLRDAVINRSWTPAQAAQDALMRSAALAPGSTEDASAFKIFADDMRLELFRR
jgi:hypothetical protein